MIKMEISSERNRDFIHGIASFGKHEILDNELNFGIFGKYVRFAWSEVLCRSQATRNTRCRFKRFRAARVRAWRRSRRIWSNNTLTYLRHEIVYVRGGIFAQTEIRGPRDSYGKNSLRPTATGVVNVVDRGRSITKRPSLAETLVGQLGRAIAR